MDTQLGDQLVKNHLAVCLPTSEESGKFVAQFISKPLVAAMACDLAKGHFSSVLEQVLNGFQQGSLVSPSGGHAWRFGSSGGTLSCTRKSKACQDSNGAQWGCAT